MAAAIQVKMGYADWQYARDNGMTLEQLARQRLADMGADLSVGTVAVLSGNVATSEYVYEWSVGP